MPTEGASAWRSRSAPARPLPQPRTAALARYSFTKSPSRDGSVCGAEVQPSASGCFIREIQRREGGLERREWLNLASGRRLYCRYSTANIDIRDRIWAIQGGVARVRGEFVDTTRWDCPCPGRVCRCNKVGLPVSGESLPMQQGGIACVRGKFADATRWDCLCPGRVCRCNQVGLPVSGESLPMQQGRIARVRGKFADATRWHCRRARRVEPLVAKLPLATP